jgi:peptidoglycan/LPS O-acetylase OafA/YrhL
VTAEKEKPVSGFSTRVQKRQFHTFDALRFLAFFKVFLLHVPIVAFSWFNFIKAGGGIGVQFFFVLSGFLITYIILEEKQQTGTLNLKNFFVRRMLRIWPLYYLMVAVAYTTPYILQHILHISSSGEGYEPKLWVSMLFLENYQMMIAHDHANVSPLSVMWSLCIEEHFYIVWGFLLYFFAISRVPFILLTAIVLAPICRYIYVTLDIPTSDILTNIDLFAYGAIPAFLLVRKGSVLESYIEQIEPLYKWCWIAITTLAVVWFSQFKTDADYIIPTSLLGILFSGLLFIILPQQSQFKIRNGNILARLGAFTYGLYMYHTLVINLLKQLYIKADWDINTGKGAVSFFGVALAGTIVISILSYYLFEKPFLKLKKYFQ